MIEKINLDSDIWSAAENKQLKSLIEEFALHPYVESDLFREIADCIWESGTCYPMFFVAIPYLVEIAAKFELDDSKALWQYLGCWVSTHEKYRNIVSEEILECFDNSLQYAEEVCIKQLASSELLKETDAQYLYASLFAFARHRLGYMSMSGYKDDFVGTSIAKCPNGHLNDVSIYNSGIVAYEEDESPRSIVDIGEVDIDDEITTNNYWRLFETTIQEKMTDMTTERDVRSHLELAKKIIRKGINPNLRMSYAFSLYGSLLYCAGAHDAGMRIFHGWDEIVCAECGEKFVFADGWCEDEF